MLNPNVLKALRVIALEQADSFTFDAWYKSICRWYSREFHTPLTQVLEMAQEHVVKVYYEDLFWKMKNTGDEKQQEAFDAMVDQVLLENSPKAQEEAEEIEEEDDDWYKQELEALERQLSKQTTDKTKKNAVSDQDGGLMDKPNLQATDYKFVEADDSPVPDEDEGTD